MSTTGPDNDEIADGPPDFATVYLAERDALMVDRLRLAMTMGLSIYAGFWVLDWVLHPSRALDFGLLRATVTMLCLGVLWATTTRWGRERVLPLSFGILAIVGFSLSAMTISLGGFGSDYFIGNMLTLFFVGLFMPWPAGVSTAFCVAVVAPYFAMNLAFHGASTAMASPAAFLIGTSALTVFANVASQRAREQDLRLRLELERANDELKALDETKTRFFANVSHELRTPLMLITGPLEELLRDQNDPAVAHLLKSMAVNADRLTRHVNMILDFAKVEAGRLRLTLRDGNVGTLLGDLVHAARPYAAQHGLELVVVDLDATPMSRFDLDQIETVAANLISNAVKFTPHGGRITVRAFATETTVGFEVSDTGPGISPEDLERVFDRFYQVERGAAGKSKGTGLGLALARELARLHGGSLHATSTRGAGASFRVEIPRAPRERSERRMRGRRREDRMVQARLESIISDSYEKRQGTSTLLADLHAPDTASATYAAVAPDTAPRLLIVEDNPELLAYLVRNLGSEYQIETAVDGLAGLDAARRGRPDLIVSDIMMPRLDGTEMAAKLGEDPSTARIPIILLSARAGAEAIVEGLRAGAIDYITKPFKLNELRARIAAHLRAREVEQRLDERETRLAAVGRMTGTIAHDLKGPLTAIVGHTGLARELAQESETTALLVEDLVAIEHAAHRAVDMIQEVVDYVREGSVVLRTETTAIAGFLRGIANDLAPSMRSVGIELVVENDPADAGPTIAVDRARLRRAVENLVTNAREAILEHRDISRPAESHRIELGAREQDNTVLITVADDGPGVPAASLDRIFQPFVTEGKAHGTGLGLAIVRNLVAAHGGSVHVAPPDPSRPGATFVIELPYPTGP